VLGGGRQGTGCCQLGRHLVGLNTQQDATHLNFNIKSDMICATKQFNR
jgi:hypothetical protein